MSRTTQPTNNGIKLGRYARRWVLAMGVVAMTCTGCASTTTTNTARTGNEQILISSAIDRAMSNVRFNDFANYSVFIDPQYLDGTVDKGYLIGEIRHKVLQGGGRIAAKADDADLVLEPRSGGIGTDTEETFIGIPALGMPGLPIELPEIKIAQRATQMGTAKIGLVCYDAKTGASLGRGGKTTALTHANDTYVFGIGPFRSGSVVDTRERAVGFNGVGGSLLGSSKGFARIPAVTVMEKAPNATYTPAPAPQTQGSGLVESTAESIMKPASAILNRK